MSGDPKYLGIDIETTGLDPRTGRILEIAALVLDGDLREISYLEYSIRVPRGALRNVDPFVEDIHTKNGLLVDQEGSLVQSDSTSLVSWAFAVEALCILLDTFTSPPPMLGHSIGSFDRPWLAHHAPEVTELMSHRNVDARSFVELAPDLEDSEAEKTHRALADVRHSADVCREAKRWLERGARPRIGHSGILR